jgi:hypothetical protein
VQSNDSFSNDFIQPGLQLELGNLAQHGAIIYIFLVSVGFTRIVLVRREFVIQDLVKGSMKFRRHGRVNRQGIFFQYPNFQ